MTIPVSFGECVWQFVNQRIIKNLKKIMVQSRVLVFLHCSVPPGLNFDNHHVIFLLDCNRHVQRMACHFCFAGSLHAICGMGVVYCFTSFLLICLSYLSSKTPTHPLWKTLSNSCWRCSCSFQLAENFPLPFTLSARNADYQQSIPLLLHGQDKGIWLRSSG